jgi:hypothetical protein
METNGTVGEGSFCLDAEADTNTLLSDADEFLKYARGITDLLIDTLQEEEVLDRRRMLLALGAIGALTTMGVQCACRAHQKMEWDRV